MYLVWKIRYLDRADKQFKDRYLYLETTTLEPALRATVELIVENDSYKSERKIINHRHHFAEGTLASCAGTQRRSSFGKILLLLNYFEDDSGKEITANDIAQILTGNPNARMIPSGAKQHDIDFMLSEPKPVPIAEITLTSEEIRLLGYFERDLREMLESAFMKDGPGVLKSSGMLGATGELTRIPSRQATLETAVTDDEIRSFVTIFRRLYMTGPHDPASFVKVIPVFVKALGDDAHGKWVDGVAKDYESYLLAVPDARPMVAPGFVSFTTKRLIDVFLYTQFAHQPDEKKQRQFNEGGVSPAALIMRLFLAFRVWAWRRLAH